MGDKKYLSKTQMEEMGVTLLKEYVEAGNTIITSKEGMEHLKSMDYLEQFQKQMEELQMKISLLKPGKKPHHKYPSNYTPSPKRHRKK